jgi:asparagine synthase (glutamine-hydrolysing)
MCGIAGQARADERPIRRTLIEGMCAALEHRGPDARGVHIGARVGLGIQRLRVIDLETGDQPIRNEDGSVVVVFNGEIYNYRELRAQLRAKGHRFATEGDTEVIVHLYEEHGASCVRLLDGMFAFALWDAREATLLLARDRVGKKPLFYAQRESSLTFASELGALVVDEEIERRVDPRALDCFLAYGCIQAPLSIFQGVSKLPPASTLLYRDGKVEIARYWRLDYSRKRAIGDRREIASEVRESIRQAVRKRLISDVPLGAFLSGGIDSSAVVWAMAQASSEPVKTFSIGFASEDFDELPHARTIARLFGTEHHELVVEPDAIEVVPRIVRHYGEPFADASAIPSFYVSEMTRRHVTVALNGDGGDESFGGYSRYAAMQMMDRLARLPRPVPATASALAGWLPAGRAVNGRRERIRRLLGSLALAPPARYARYMACFDEREREALYTDELKAELGESAAPAVIAEPWLAASGSSPIDVALEVDVEFFLPADLLVKIDIATMAHSLEARSPLLDPALMQLAASLPPELKVHGTQKKVILREAMRGHLPDEILDRPKQGFGVPLVHWLRGELRQWSREILLDDAAVGRGYFRRERVQWLLDRHASGREDCSTRIWALLMLELWHRELVDSARPAQIARSVGRPYRQNGHGEGS